MSAFQDFLHATPAGTAFFGNVAQPGTVKRILTQAYGDPATVTDELVDCILRPGLTEGAPRVFLDFISYSGGPLPEEQLARVPKEVPVVMLWGEKDPWEKASAPGRMEVAHVRPTPQLAAHVGTDPTSTVPAD